MYVFIYFWWHWVFIAVSSCGEQRPLPRWGARASQGRLLFFRSVVSRAQGLQERWAQAESTRGLFPDQGWNPCPLDHQKVQKKKHTQAFLLKALVLRDVFMTTAEHTSTLTRRPPPAPPPPPSLPVCAAGPKDPQTPPRALSPLHCVRAASSALIRRAPSSSPYDAPLRHPLLHEPPDPVFLQAGAIIALLQAHRNVFKALLHSPRGTLSICSHVDLLNLDCGFLEVRGHILFIFVSPKANLQEALQDLW